ncbi:hypothetical protein BpHYR1_017362 [Brachionus plicatilis]|uniref:Uncharacterized protein n=1 Tax=Brachionus plicatilis TaxID=10195 RepID=A0A3M7QUN3_BRAPC|nr:hypothetical protein BpHYR1_017362 [Brachionus plicatilis]
MSRQISNEIKALKGSFLSEKFSALNQFNQSESKCWNLLNNFIDPNKASLNKKIIKLRKNETISEDPEEVANLFGEHLEKIFTADHCSTNLPSMKTSISPVSVEKITKDEFLSSLKELKNKASADSNGTFPDFSWT